MEQKSYKNRLEIITKIISNYKNQIEIRDIEQKSYKNRLEIITKIIFYYKHQTEIRDMK